MAQKSITIDDKVNEQVEELAKRERRSFSNMVEVLIEKGINTMDQ
jgi:predicted CopG family antitoxin